MNLYSRKDVYSETLQKKRRPEEKLNNYIDIFWLYQGKYYLENLDLVLFCHIVLSIMWVALVLLVLAFMHER